MGGKKKITATEIDNLNIVYENEWIEFIKDANKKGFTDEQLSENPIALLHLFYLWIGRSKY
jgi:hypothetical protein